MDVYQVPEVLTNIDAHPATVLLAGAIANTGAYLLYIEGIRLGFRHRTFAVPVFANMYFFAHDVLFVVLFDHWFNEVDHWLFKMFWAALLVFSVLECVVHYQTLKFGRRELFPGLDPRQYVVAYAAMQAAVIVLLWFVYTHLGDPLFLLTFSTTIIVAIVWYIPLLLRRRSREGQSFLIAIALVLLNAYFFMFLPLMSDAFAAPVYHAAGTVTTALSVIYLWLLTRYPAYVGRDAPQPVG
ncbi:MULTISPECIES: hypothetical protein [Streptosporangium]|uniref:Drug/metabolite transporter superfamily protein YnfA n=1 Tax=Streptosporangium brasiliense TaxID=47480 RepID=A0ABT9RI31_9ACTN|nr:hypothetical protein [Streptosporangium brasiliense]MDP9868000.1 drug/metabolite transporter superfamily protein YnfA [Streptosporangium brasiliense]